MLGEHRVCHFHFKISEAVGVEQLVLFSIISLSACWNSWEQADAGKLVGGTEWISAADGWVGVCVIICSYFCLSAILAFPFHFSSVCKDTGGLFVHLCLCHLCCHQYFSLIVDVIIAHKVQKELQLQTRTGPILEREADTNQLCFLPSLPVFFHQQIADWLHKVLERKKMICIQFFEILLDPS